MTDLDRLVMEIETDGTITPHDAIRQAAETLVEHFQVVAGKLSTIGQVTAREDRTETGASKINIEEINLCLARQTP